MDENNLNDNIYNENVDECDEDDNTYYEDGDDTYYEDDNTYYEDGDDTYYEDDNDSSDNNKTIIGGLLAFFLGLIGLFIGMMLYPENSTERKTFIKGWTSTFIIITIIAAVVGLTYFYAMNTINSWY